MIAHRHGYMLDWAVMDVEALLDAVWSEPFAVDFRAFEAWLFVVDPKHRRFRDRKAAFRQLLLHEVEQIIPVSKMVGAKSDRESW
jgi:hypothetical protein